MNNINQKHNQKGFVLAFVIAVIAALSVMTSAMFFYYDTDLKSVSRNSVMQQVMLAAETGLQEGQKFVEDRLNANQFDLVDIQNTNKVVASDNKCLNRHGFTDSSKDVYFARRISEDLTNNAGSDDPKFAGMSYEVFVQRHADVVKSIYFSGTGTGANTNLTTRSMALVKKFKDFPNKKFTIEMWVKNKRPDSVKYNMHAFEWGREWDLVFKVWRKTVGGDDEWSPRLGEVVLDAQESGDNTVGNPIRNEWTHIAWVWDGGSADGNVKIYQNGTLSGTFNANINPRSKSGYTNPDDQLPAGDHWPLAIGEGLHGFAPNNYLNGQVKMQGVPWLGNISEMRIWNIARTADDIANNNRKRLSGSEPGLVSYYKFSEGSGDTAKDYNTSRAADRRNDAKVYGIGTQGTLWKTELAKYPVTADTGGSAPSINVPPGEDIVYYKIMSCGIGPQGQIVPLELIVSAPVQQGDVGDGKIALTSQDVASLSGEEGTPLEISLNPYIAQPGVTDDIKIQTKDVDNSNFYAFKPSLEQCTNRSTHTAFSTTVNYTEGQCVTFNGKTYIAEKDDGISSGNQFNEDDWVEILGSGCDGVQFMDSGEASHGHYFKYFATAPDLSVSGNEVGYNRDSIDWWEAKRRAEASTCGGLRGYLVSVDSADENEFLRKAVMCDNSTASGCSGAKPFHVAAGKSRGDYYGARMSQTSSQHYIWLGNSDWRTPLTMRSESGPNMGSANGYVNWQNGEPNGGGGGEDYADMEINRADRDNGEWNDLARIPNCQTTALDCITGYIVEYGGFDSFRMDKDVANNKEDVLTTTKFCVARATIEKDKYVKDEDFLKYDTSAEDYVSTITHDNTGATDTTNYPGWNKNTGVLTLKHTSKPSDWVATNNYTAGDFTWYNNRVWKALVNVTGSTLTPGQIPSIYNPTVWEYMSGNESDAPCTSLTDWQNAFESIKYYNAKANEADEGTNPYLNEQSAQVADSTSTEEYISLGERVILFSLGPLHVNKHVDGYNHFYEFYKFPEVYNDRNRRFNEGYHLAHRLSYFGKTGYLATITSETENDIIVEKAKGNGWLGGMTQTLTQNTDANLDRCGGPRQRANRAQAAADFVAMRDVNNMPIYTRGANYSNGQRLVAAKPVLGSSVYATTNKTVSEITRANPAVVTTSANHNLTTDDIIRITDNSLGTLGVSKDDDTDWGLTTGYYRVRVLTSTTFSLHHMITRANIDTSAISTAYPSSDDARIRELEGVVHEYYRASAAISGANANVDSQANLTMFFKDPHMSWAKNNRSVDSDWEHSQTKTAAQCPAWRWITGPEQFILNGRGLQFAPAAVASNDPSANQNSSDADWTRSSPSGQQVGEVFKDGMPFRYFAGTGEPNNVRNSEHALHMLGDHFAVGTRHFWNDLHNWSRDENDAYGIRGLIIEYGGMENDGDSITRVAAKRVINLYDRRVTKAVVDIVDGSETGDKISFDATELTQLGLTVTNNDTNSVTITGDATCQNYLDTIKSGIFKHNATSAGTREIRVRIGDVVKPAGSDDYYYRVVKKSLSYEQANFQATYQNLCGIQGYLATVSTTAERNAVKSLDFATNEELWINGTDECEGGIYRSGFWRYTSGPLTGREFWRTRINSTLSLDDGSACDETAVLSPLNKRVGPFTGSNFLANHPAANNNNYLSFLKTAADSTTGIKTRTGTADSDVVGMAVRFGGSVGDFTGADIEERDNDIAVRLGPIRAEINFYTDGSQNSIYIDGQDSVDVTGLSDDWTKAQSFTSNTAMLQITPPANSAPTMKQWRKELAKVFYQNLQVNSFMPGNRRIKVKLVYGDTSKNVEVGILKTIGSRNRVVVTPISWNNR